jgi:cobyrinic acid a,c-diamide synthase
VPGLILAAPASGSGKTTITLGLLRAMSRRGIAVRGAKSGPDYIDPRFHEAACGVPCVNLDAWAMSAARIAALAEGPGLLLIEGAMGLFDGAPPEGKGATADLARQLGLPVILIVDASHMGQSIAPLVAGFATHDPDVRIAGIILNRTGSPRHEAMLRRALSPLGIPILGVLRRETGLTHPSRHLGLIQASERPDLGTFIEHVATLAEGSIDIDALLALAPSSFSKQSGGVAESGAGSAPRPPAASIAIARDQAFAFTYPHLLGDWHRGGATLHFFSPLADEAVPKADLIFLPGGYPELHAARLSSASNFMQSLRHAAQDTLIYGECGGYMTLGETLTAAEGTVHPMAGLLELHTSFATRRLHLGYRQLIATSGPFPGTWAAHEFHYATTISAIGAPLFTANDAEGTVLPAMGLINGNVTGSFAHLIDRV